MTGKFYLAKDLIYERLVQHCRVSSDLKTFVPKKKIYKGYYTQTKLYSALLIWFMTIFVSAGFKAPSQLFAEIENSQARDNFIKSIKFTGTG
jgi:hypothetical protein